MQVTATLKNLRIAPRKVRLVAGAVKGLDAVPARQRLAYVAKRSALPLAKLLDSALANAAQNSGLVRDNLFIKDVIVNEGMKLKRGRPKGFGSVSPIEKKTSHIKIVLAERVPGLRAQPETKAKAENEVSEAKTRTKKASAEKIVNEDKKSTKTAGARMARKIFQRKTG